MAILGINGSRGVSLLGQLGLMVGAITICILSGIYIDTDSQFGKDASCDFEGYGTTGLTIATIACSGTAVLFQIVGMLVTFLKKDDAIALQLFCTGVASLLVCVSSVLIGALLGVIIDTPGATNDE